MTMTTDNSESGQPMGLAADRPVKPRTPKGVVALLVGPDGHELANASDFGTGAPAGFSRRDFQETQARRALALAAVGALASPRMGNALDVYLAEQIMRAMCNKGCRVVIVPVGYDE